MEVSARRRLSIYSLFLVIAIDTMGFGFLFPVLTPLFFDTHSSMLSGVADVSILYGLVIALYPLFMFVGAPLLGDLSDTVGRKRVLVICLIGAFVSYGLGGVAISMGSYGLLCLSRVLGGLTAGSMPLAQAAISDCSVDKGEQARFLGWMMFAVAGGQVLGPVLSGLFTEISFAAPFYFAALLGVFNLGLLLVTYKETFISGPFDLKKVTKTLRSYSEVFTAKEILLMTGVFVCMQLSWSFYSQASPAFLQQWFGYENIGIMFFSAALGVGIAVGGIGVMPYMSRHVHPKQGAVFGLLLMGLGMGTGAVAPMQSPFWVGVIFSSIGAVLAYSFIVILFSGLVDESRQGWVMGITGAVIGLAWALTAILSGVIIAISAIIPEYLAALFAFGGVALVWRVKCD